MFEKTNITLVAGDVEAQSHLEFIRDLMQPGSGTILPGASRNEANLNLAADISPEWSTRLCQDAGVILRLANPDLS